MTTTTTTTQRVLAIRAADPERLAAHIAKEVGVSPERVRQILKKHGLPTNMWHPSHCRDCGKQIKHKSIRCRACYHKLCWVDVTCYYCKASIKKARSQMTLDYARYFCSASHRAKWATLPGNYGYHNLQASPRRLPRKAPPP
jgi:predicted Zn-ribbon and HTH transcriptional regulator